MTDTPPGDTPPGDTPPGDTPPGDTPPGDRPPAGTGDPSCPHTERHEGVCVVCGHCVHEVILNRACFLCGTTDLDPIALSPKKPVLIAPDQLVRKK